MPKQQKEKPTSDRRAPTHFSKKTAGEKGSQKNIFKKAAHKVREVREKRRKSAIHKSFRLSRRSEMPKLEKLPSALRLMRRTLAILWGQKSIIIVLLVLFIIVAWSINGMFALTDFADLKNVLLDGESIWSIDGISVLFDSFFTAQTAIAQQKQPALIMLNLVSLLFWLAFIWLARYQIAKKATGVREALYTSGTSLVPFLLLLGAIFIQCIPGAYGFSLAASIASGQVFVGGFEIAMFSLLALLLIVISVYFIVGTIMALQVVALPGMYPWKALQNARRLVMGRRFSVLRKYIVLIVVLALVWIALFTPTLVFESAVCGVESCWVGITILPFVYYLLFGFIIMFASTYLYVTYRALLDLQEK